MKSIQSILSIKKLPKLFGRRLTRGEFLRSMGRYALLAAIAVVAAMLIRRRRGGAADGAPAGGCETGYDLPCSQCAELSGCGLARAARTREAIRSGKS